MSITAWQVAGVALFVVIIVVVVGFSRRKGGAQRTKARVKGPFGMGVDTESSSEITPGVRIHDATSEEGGLTASDQTGRGLEVKKVQTKRDISITNELPSGTKGPADPKT